MNTYGDDMVTKQNWSPKLRHLMFCDENVLSQKKKKIGNEIFFVTNKK